MIFQEAFRKTFKNLDIWNNSKLYKCQEGGKKISMTFFPKIGFENMIFVVSCLTGYFKLI